MKPWKNCIFYQVIGIVQLAERCSYGTRRSFQYHDSFCSVGILRPCESVFLFLFLLVWEGKCPGVLSLPTFQQECFQGWEVWVCY